MKTDKIEFKIVKDTDGKAVSLESMSIEATRALVVFVESLTKIAVAAGQTASAKISITKGSACVALEAPDKEIEEIEKEIQLVADNKSRKREFVEPLREIQRVISSNSLQYEAVITKDKQKTPVIEIFKRKKVFRIATKKRTEPTFGIKFIEGKLIENGGKNPNIHILHGDEKTTVSCSEEEAKKVNTLLYSDIKISAWELKKKGQKSDFVYCDNYLNDGIFNDFQNFIESNFKKEGTEPLKDIHNKIADIIEGKDFGYLNKFLKLFSHERVDIGTLRTILVTTKAFRADAKIKSSIDKIQQLLQSKIEKPLV